MNFSYLKFDKLDKQNFSFLWENTGHINAKTVHWEVSPVPVHLRIAILPPFPSPAPTPMLLAN